MGIFDSSGNVAGPVRGSGGGSIDWTKQQSYNVYSPQASEPKRPNISFGSIAHGFLNGLAETATNAIHHPLQTAVDVGKGLVDSAVNDVKTAASFPVTAAKGVYHLGAAGIDAATGNKAAAMKHIQQMNSDYQNSYIGKTYGSKSKGDVSGLGKAVGFGLDALGAKGAGGLIKGVAANAGESLLKTAGKTALKGAGEGAALGAGYGAAGAAQQNDLSGANIAKNVASGALTGAAAGGVAGGAAGAARGAFEKQLNQAIDKWVGLRTQVAMAQHVDATKAAADKAAAGAGSGTLPAGQKPMALPAGQKAAEPLGLPANATATGDIKETPGGGVFGNFNEVSPDTASRITRLNQIVHNYQVQGKSADAITHLGNLAAMRTNAADVVDRIAADRSDMLQQMHKENGGVDTLKNDSNPGGATYSRASRNDPFYRQFYETHGHAPTKEAWLEEAHMQLSTGKDEQAQHYQQAMEVAQKASDVYDQHAQKIGKSAGDIHKPNVSPEKAAKASEELTKSQAQAGKERLGQQNVAEPAPPKASAQELTQHLEAIRSGHAPGSELVALNHLIEHPDVSSEAKAQYVMQRDELKPSAKSAAKEETPAPATTHARTEPTGNPGKTATPTPYVETAATTARKAKTQAARDSLTQPKREPVYAQDYVVEKEKTPKVTTSSHDTGPVGKDSDVAGKKGNVLERLFDKATKDKGAGLVNPSRAASRQGNVGLSRAATDLVSSKRQRTYAAKDVVSQYKGLAKGLDHGDIAAAIEGGTPKDSKVAAAAAFFQAHRDAIGSESVGAGTLKGLHENYLPHVGLGMDSPKRVGNGSGLSKSTRYNIERQSIEHLDANGDIVKEDKYKTLDEFDKAIKELGGKGAERDTAKLLEHMLVTQGHAIENAKTVEKLMDTRMTDGRPSLARTTESNLADPKYRGYSIIDNKLVHPDAKNLYEAITKTGRIDNPIGRALTNTNVLTKRLVTLNGMVHALNIWKSSFAAQGVTRSIWAIGSRGASKEDFMRALGYGAKFARASNDNLFDEVGKATGLLGKFEKLTDPLTKALFHSFGDRQGMSTYKYIEGKMLKRGLSADEAGRIAADGANQVMHFIPEDQQSIVVRQSSQLALFAGQFLQNTLKTATNAFGVGLDRTLSKEAQRAAQGQAIARISRMFAYSFASAQAINLAATGKYTWQNGNGDALNPVWYKDPKTGKEYRITNHYGQLKDLFGFLTNPAQEIQNKLAPGARELVSQVANTDLFTGNKIAKTTDSEGAQLIDRMVHAASNTFTPAGINLSTPSKQPALVQAARYVGVNSSSVKPNDHYDYTKGAADKKSAQSLIDAYAKGDKSKLAAMQALKAAGNGHFDKFFAAHPELDPTSKSFQGFAGNNNKQISAGIKAGFDVAKANGTSLAYMQSVQESGNKYFQKFFAKNANLDPTSNQYDGTGSKQAERQKSEAKYQRQRAKYAASKYTRSKGGKTPSLTRTVKSTKVRVPRARKVGASGLLKAKKVRIKP